MKNDQPTFGFYTLVESDGQLRALAEEMKANARNYPLNPDTVASAIVDEPGEKERIGPMVRIHGKQSGEHTRRYSRFITFSDKEITPLQISYVEYSVDGEAGVVKQLTIADNSLNPLQVKDITRIGHFFLNMKDASSPSVDTPPHVAILFNLDEGI